MTTEQTTATDFDDTEITEETPDPNTSAELRAYADRLKEENVSLRAGAIGGALREIGLKSDEGLGLAIAETFDGEITVENVATFAQEKYKHTAENAPVPAEVIEGEKLETLAAASTPVTPPPETDSAQEATDKMHDPTTGRDEAIDSLNAKMAQFQEEHY